MAADPVRPDGAGNSPRETASTPLAASKPPKRLPDVQAVAWLIVAVAMCASGVAAYIERSHRQQQLASLRQQLDALEKRADDLEKKIQKTPKAARGH